MAKSSKRIYTPWLPKDTEELKKALPYCATVTEVYYVPYFAERKFGDCTIQRKVLEHGLKDLIGTKLTPEGGDGKPIGVPERINAAKEPKQDKTELLVDAVKESMKSVKATPLPKLRVSTKKPTEEVILTISDVHGGKKTPSFDFEILQSRFANWLRRVKRLLEIMRAGSNISKCTVLVLGDVIDNDMIYRGHSTEVETYVGKQLAVLTGMFIPVFKELLGEFHEIRVLCVRGNHGIVNRDGSKDSNWDTILYHAIAQAFVDEPRISFEIEDHWDTMVANICGWGCLLNHGARIRMYNQTPWYGVKGKTTKWRSAKHQKLVELGTTGMRYCFIGHFHSSGSDFNNGMDVYLNGCWPTGDSYGEDELGYLPDNRQWMFTIHPKEGINDEKRIDVTR